MISCARKADVDFALSKTATSAEVVVELALELARDARRIRLTRSWRRLLTIALDSPPVVVLRWGVECMRDIDRGRGALMPKRGAEVSDDVVVLVVVTGISLLVSSSKCAAFDGSSC